ncbi:MAG: MSMEG_0565 family glycosyltransferase [Cyanobacteria bacterium P01_G01_bin.54]
MRIALLTYSTKPRGGVIHTMELAEALHRLGQDVCIFALNKDGGQFCRLLQCNSRLVPTQPPGPTTDRLVQQRIQEYVDYFQAHPEPYNIYHAQDCISANALVMLRNQGYPIPQIIRTVHHIDSYNSPYLQDCQDKSIRLPDRCLCVSRYWQQELQRQYSIDAPLVFNGVDASRYGAAPDGTEARLKARLGIIGAPVFLTVGGVEPRKNSIRLVQAFAQVRETLPQAQLVIAGGMTLFDYSDYREAFFAEAERLGIEVGKALLLSGVIEDHEMPTLYRSADAFVFPSVKEGWGLVVMEAIAAQLPVLTADRPPFTEFLTPKQALLVDVEDVADIAQGMRQILKPEIGRSLIQNSQSILKQYTWENSAKMHLKVYERLGY